MMKRSAILIAATMAATAISGVAYAQSGPIIGTEAMREWNLIVLGNLQSSSEVEGRTFVGGDLIGGSSNYMIVGGQSTGQYDLPGLTVVGNVTGGHKNLNNGSGAIVGGNVESGFNLNGGTQNVKVGGTISNTNINHHNVQSGLRDSDSNFSSNLERQNSLLSSSMTDLSNDFAGLKSNSEVVIRGNTATFNAAPGTDGVAVFNLTSDQLNQIGEIAFNLNGATTAVVNVSGKNINLNDNFLGNVDGLAEKLIWNFSEAEKLDLSTAWRGSVLAPNADATTRNYIQGSGVFKNLQQDGEMHIGTYHGGYTPPTGGSSSGGSSSGGTPVDVPEAPAIGLFLGGVVGLAFLRRRIARRAAAKAAE